MAEPTPEETDTPGAALPPSGPSDPQPAVRREGSPPPDRTGRDPGEGPARDGGSGLAADEEPADEEIGGGD